MSTSEQEEYLGRFATGPWRMVYTAATKKLENARFAGVMENHERVEGQWVCTKILVDDGAAPYSTTVDHGDHVLTYCLTRRKGTPTGRAI